MQHSPAQFGTTRISNMFGGLSELSDSIPDVQDQLEFPDIIEGPNYPKVACPIIPKDKGFKTASQKNTKDK